MAAVVGGDAQLAQGGNDIRRAYIEMGWSTRVPLDDYLAMVRTAFEAGASVKRARAVSWEQWIFEEGGVGLERRHRPVVCFSARVASDQFYGAIVAQMGN